jgi:dipeptidase E
MALMLTSAGVTNGSIRNELRRLVARPFDTASVAVVMTAAVGDAADHSWLMADLQRLHRLGWRTFNLIDLNGLPAELVLRRLRGAQVIYFAGGNVYQLAHSLATTGLAQNVKNLLGCTVVVGASAGSLVFCADLTHRLTSLYGGDDDLFQTYGRKGVSPLDVVPWFLRPHTDFDTWDSAQAEAAGFPMFAIDDQTAITVTDRDVVVVSEGRWRFMPGQPAGVLTP